MPILLPILGASAAWLAAAAAGGATVGVLYYYGGKSVDDHHQRKLVEAYKAKGPKGFRKYAWKVMGIRSRDKTNALWDALGPRAVRS